MTQGVRGVSLYVQRFVCTEYTVKRNKQGIKTPGQAELAVDSLFTLVSPSAPLKLGIFVNYGTKNIQQTRHLQYMCHSPREQVFPSVKRTAARPHTQKERVEMGHGRTTGTATSHLLKIWYICSSLVCYFTCSVSSLPDQD